MSTTNHHLRTYVGPPSDLINLGEFKHHIAPKLLQASNYYHDNENNNEQRNEIAAERCSVKDLTKQSTQRFSKHVNNKPARSWLATRMTTGTRDPLPAIHHNSLSRPATTPAPTAATDSANNSTYNISSMGSSDDQQKPQHYPSKRRKKSAKSNIVAGGDGSTSTNASVSATSGATTPLATLESFSELTELKDWILSCPLQQAQPDPMSTLFVRDFTFGDINTLNDLLSASEQATPSSTTATTATTSTTTATTSSSSPSTHRFKSTNEVLLTITVYPLPNYSNKHAVPSQGQTLHVLSSSYLSQFRDSISCDADSIPAVNPRMGKYTFDPIVAPAVMLIEDFIYSDTRQSPDDYHPSDSPQEICQHVCQVLKDNLNPKRSLTHPPIEQNVKAYEHGMQHVTWDNLSVRIGNVYWLRHAGNCEHLFTIDSIRLVHPNDPKPSPDLRYPLTTSLSRCYPHKCKICERDPATFCKINDPLMGDTPAHICKICLELMYGPLSNIEDLPRSLKIFPIVPE